MDYLVSIGSLCPGAPVASLVLSHIQGQNKLVHRDLATRNVLVVSPTEVKVSDFGLARQFKEDKNYYPSSQSKDVPIFWSVRLAITDKDT